ncbi:DDRGK domain-containing protein 1 [Aix galericulata]|nr:DDRGK domain-containing protein 1 [Aix galericulata]
MKGNTVNKQKKHNNINIVTLLQEYMPVSTEVKGTEAAVGSPAGGKKTEERGDVLSFRKQHLKVIFKKKYFKNTEEEPQQNAAVAAAVARPRPHIEERGDGMPRRRRNMGSRLLAQRRAQQAEEWAEEEDDAEEVPELQVSGKIGAKKQRKLEEKQARKAQREAEEAEREERKKLESKREEERRKEEERIRLEEERQPKQYSRSVPRIQKALWSQELGSASSSNGRLGSRAVGTSGIFDVIKMIVELKVEQKEPAEQWKDRVQ